MILSHAAREVGELRSYRPGVVMDVSEVGPSGVLQLIRITVDRVRQPAKPTGTPRLYVGGLAADRVYRHVWVTVV